MSDPDRLTDAALFEREVPAAWRPLLEGLSELEGLLAQEGPPDERRRSQASAVVARLLPAAGALAGSSPPALGHRSAEHTRWFTEAVLLWLDFDKAGGRILIDSHRSRTLASFVPDLRARPTELSAIRTALARCFSWSQAEISRIEGTVARRTSNLRLKEAITTRLLREVTSPVGSPELEGEALVLFRRLFGPLPFRPGDVEITLTTTALVFGIPFENGALLKPDFAGRPEVEREAIRSFLQKVEKLQSSFDSLRFPGFGLYERDHVDPTLLEALTAAAARMSGFEVVRPQVVAETLATMVTLIPAQKAEMFLVHDLWGHGWEESLCDFEWSYARLVELRAPIGPATGTQFHGDGPVLRDAFVASEAGVRLDRDTLTRVVGNDLRGRIRLALNVVVAEALANLVEHKYVRRRGRNDLPLPTSSLLPEAPLKTDLSLRDTQSLLKAATRSYRRLLDSPSEARRLTDELRAAGLPAEGLAEATAVALEAIGVEFQSVLDTGMTAPAPAAPDTPGPATLPVNLAQRVMLGMLALTEALTRFLDQADADCGPLAPGTRWRCPRACIDLLVLVLGWFYEQDRELHFWHLDELLRTELAPTLHAFERQLKEGI